MMNAASLLADGFLVINDAFHENDPGLKSLEKFTSLISSQQVCLEMEEIKEHTEDPKSVFEAAQQFRSHVIKLIERTLNCSIEKFDEPIGKDLDYVRRKCIIGSFTPIHRDSEFLKKDRYGIIHDESDLKHFYTVWISFTSLTKKHSHLEVQPRSHVCTQDGHLSDTRVNSSKRRKLSWRKLILKKYSLVIFSSTLKHRASAHREPHESRTSIDFRFKIKFNEQETQ